MSSYIRSVLTALVATGLLTSCTSSPRPDQDVLVLSSDDLTICVRSAGSSMQWTSTTNTDGCEYGGDSNTQESNTY